jgi:hypothetical protein
MTEYDVAAWTDFASTVAGATANAWVLLVEIKR